MWHVRHAVFAATENFERLTSHDEKSCNKKNKRHTAAGKVTSLRSTITFTDTEQKYEYKRKTRDRAKKRLRQEAGWLQTKLHPNIDKPFTETGKCTWRRPNRKVLKAVNGKVVQRYVWKIWKKRTNVERSPSWASSLRVLGGHNSTTPPFSIRSISTCPFREVGMDARGHLDE